MRRDARRSPATTILRGKVVLTAIALAAAVALVVVASWPLKVLVVLAFVRGLFATDLIALRNPPRRRSSEQAPPTPRSPAHVERSEVRSKERVVSDRCVKGHEQVAEVAVLEV